MKTCPFVVGQKVVVTGSRLDLNAFSVSKSINTGDVRTVTAIWNHFDAYPSVQLDNSSYVLVKDLKAQELVQITPRIKGRVVGDKVVQVETKQSVSGGATANMMRWAGNAHQKGFKHLIVATKAKDIVLEQLQTAVEFTNDTMIIQVTLKEI